MSNILKVRSPLCHTQFLILAICSWLRPPCPMWPTTCWLPSQLLIKTLLWAFMSLKEIILVLRALFPLCEKLPLAILHSYTVSLRWNGTVTCALRTPHMEPCALWMLTAVAFRSMALSRVYALCLLLLCWLYPFFSSNTDISHALFSLRLCLLWLSYWVDLQVQLPSLSPALATAKVCRTSALGSRGHISPPSFKGEL